MEIAKIKTLSKTFIISLLCFCFVVSCHLFDKETELKKSVRKQVEEVFSKLEKISYSDIEQFLYENKNVDEYGIKWLVENYDNRVKKDWFGKNNINYHTDYLYKIISEIGNIKEGDTVVDLGSGFGLDCILLKQIIVGEKGKVTGVDIDESSNIVARKYSDHLGYSNVDFILGDARELQFDDNVADVVISNFTLTLISEKEKVFSEIFRILKEGGNCYIGDAILYGDNFELLKKMKIDTLYADWYVRRSISEAEYVKMLERIGFKNIKIEITDFTMIDAEGRLLGVPNTRKYRDKIISASIYIFAEK